MNSVGIDLHKRRSHIAALSDDGRRLLSRRIDSDPATFVGLLAEIDGESKVALEATYGWEGSPMSWRRPATSSISRIRCGPRRSPRHGSRRTRSTP